MPLVAISGKSTVNNLHLEIAPLENLLSKTVETILQQKKNQGHDKIDVNKDNLLLRFKCSHCNLKKMLHLIKFYVKIFETQCISFE